MSPETTPPAPEAPPPLPRTPIFRWKNLRHGGIAVAILVVFSVFFMDLSVKWGLEKAGTAANGAKVELDGVSISLLHLRVTLTGLQVTDANNPMTNSLEAGRMTFKLAPQPLFWKKVVIEDAAIEGLRTGTARRTSGAVKRKEDAAPEKKAAPAAPGSSTLDDLKKKFNPADLKAEDLASYKRIKEEQVHWAAASESWQARVDAVKTDDMEKEVKAFVEKVRTTSFSGAEGLKKAAELGKEGKRLKADLDAAKGGFDAIRNDLGAEIGRAKDGLKEIEALKKQDADGALGDLKGAFSTEGIVRRLVGPEWMGKIDTGLAWFRKIRSMIPPKKKGEKAPPPPPRRGTDVTFPFKHNWPDFLLKKSSLGGETPGGLEYAGTLRDVTSDPKAWGRPITLEIDGKKGPEALTLRAELDYTKDAARERVRMSYAGFPLAGAKLGDAAGGPVTIAKGAGKALADVETQGERISGRIDFSADPAALAHPPPPPGGRLYPPLHDGQTGVKKLDASFLVSGRLAAPAVEVKSSLDREVAGAVKAAAQKELDDLRAKAQARVQELVGGDQNKLSALVDGRAGETAKKLGLKDKQIQSARDQVQKALGDLLKKEASPVGGGAKTDLKKLFKKK
jgi:uncharacterized protein (TIGR03545 family)